MKTPRLARLRRLRLGLLAMVIGVLLTPVSVQSAYASPGWRWPVLGKPVVQRSFSPPAKKWLPGHRGVDILSREGAPVLSAGSGTVAYAGQLAGRGVVVVSHGMLRTTYEPLVPGVHVGEPVAAGSLIGWLNATGSHCSPDACLHWGLLRGQEYLNPLGLLRGPSRLLPLPRRR
jgi:murein DD-endopeptidase MepM/ murein hydrolase activator NlpD